MEHQMTHVCHHVECAIEHLEKFACRCQCDVRFDFALYHSSIEKLGNKTFKAARNNETV